MSHSLSMLVGSYVVLAMVFGQVARAAEEAAPKPPELKVLDRLVGTWDSESISRPAEWTPKEVRLTAVLTREWVLGGRFVQERASDSNKMEATVMFGFDPQKKVYRVWRFDSEGSALEMTLQWDEATQTLSGQTDLGNGLTNTTSIHFIDNDTHEWKGVVKDAAGKVFFDGGGTCRRRK